MPTPTNVAVEEDPLEEIPFTALVAVVVLMADEIELDEGRLRFPSVEAVGADVDIIGVVGDICVEIGILLGVRVDVDNADRETKEKDDVLETKEKEVVCLLLV